MSDVIFLYRFTRLWIFYPKWRSLQAACPTFTKKDAEVVFRYTRQWIHYGLFAHIVICTLVGAVEGVFGR